MLSQWERYQLQCEETGRWGLWRRAIQRYFGYDSNGTRSDLVTFAGERGQVVKVTANHYRSLLKHILVMSTAQRPALRARATNADARSLSDTKLAEGLLDYYLTEEGVETRLVRSVEIGLNVAECDVCVT